MSVSEALYGLQIKHASVRYYARAAPKLLGDVGSFAVVRDPVERFQSAFDYAKAGGSRDSRISAPFRERYMAFRSLDDALDHVERALAVPDRPHLSIPVLVRGGRRRRDPRQAPRSLRQGGRTSLTNFSLPASSKHFELRQKLSHGGVHAHGHLEPHEDGLIGGSPHYLPPPAPLAAKTSGPNRVRIWFATFAA